jgi:endonuclease YncB( thermonuclease family)
VKWRKLCESFPWVKIRLSGVDAPELAQDFGKASRAKRWQECCNSRKDRLLKGALANRFWRC